MATPLNLKAGESSCQYALSATVTLTLGGFWSLSFALGVTRNSDRRHRECTDGAVNVYGGFHLWNLVREDIFQRHKNKKSACLGSLAQIKHCYLVLSHCCYVCPFWSNMDSLSCAHPAVCVILMGCIQSSWACVIFENASLALGFPRG